jgi:hypothetical protein
MSRRGRNSETEAEMFVREAQAIRLGLYYDHETDVFFSMTPSITQKKSPPFMSSSAECWVRNSTCGTA